jgi:replicative superfamily II helicase
MFVIDEAHLIADGDRGWRLEETISFLNMLTRETEHRLIVLSAALGNQAHVTGWIEDGTGVISRHDDWRGPRRLNVIFTTQVDWSDMETIPGRGARLPRETAPMKGILHLRTPALGAQTSNHNERPGLGPANQTTSVRAEFTEPIGTFVQRIRRNGTRVRDESSTKQREQLVPLVLHVATTGPVLVVEATRIEAQRLAEELAAKLDDDTTAAYSLIDVARSRLGANHPLSKVLQKGVAFHHSTLPIDIQTEIEDAVRNGTIRILVATMTLTDGVNLPFKTVIIGNRGYQGQDGFVELIDPPRLLNAVGRAGRAGRETEGWLILTEHQPFRSSMFSQLEQTGFDLDIRSTMASEAAIESLAQFEELVRQGEDAILASQNAITDGFISYIWFVSDALHDLYGSAAIDAVLEAIKATFAWRQLSDDEQAQLLRAGQIAFESFESQPHGRRRRWARSGMPLASAAELEILSGSVLEDFLMHSEIAGIADTLNLIIADGRLDALLLLDKNNRFGFKPYRSAPRSHQLKVDLVALLQSWVSGVELQEMADQFLSAVADDEFRHEQLAEFTARVFEHHLPWTLGVLITWVNARLQELGHEMRLPENIPAAVHFGVGSASALELMLGRVRSRRLANRVASVRASYTSASDQSLRQWLAQQEIQTWRQDFDASPTELLDLLGFTRAPEARLINDVLNGDSVKLPFIPRDTISDGADALIEPESDQPEPAQLNVSVDGSVVGHIAPQFHQDVSFLGNIGIPLSIQVEVTPAGETFLNLSLEAEQAYI